MVIRKEKDKHILYNRVGTQVLGKHGSMAASERQERAIQASKAMAKGKKEGK